MNEQLQLPFMRCRCVGGPADGLEIEFASQRIRIPSFLTPDYGGYCEYIYEYCNGNYYFNIEDCS
jgi:hypothetical protein